MDEQALFIYENPINEAIFGGNQMKVSFYSDVTGEIKALSGYIKQMD
ncbi:hypothetical protein [Exiguobacterium sp. s57]|nr:hypothetical protein [Exiguobacterium sp. s57]